MRRGVLAILLFVQAASAQSSLPAVTDGDLIFQVSRSSQSIAIQRATGSRYSHMGIVFLRNGRPYVLEAAATVRYTPLDKWISRGEGHHYVVKRLREAAKVLDAPNLGKLRASAHQLEGRPYDLTFEWSDDRIYCSELVWKIYDRALGIHIGELQRIKEFNLSDPVVQAKLRERYGSRIPLDEPVISPVAMFQSALLVTVAEH
jgi:uncharacterized protein YycO